METTTQKKSEKRSRGKILTGKVISDKMQDTAVVLVERYVKHPKYGKYIKKRKKYKADDPGNAHKVGTRVTIEETRPLSKSKHFKIVD